MKPRVYVETSIISYLTSSPSRDLIVAAHQQITREWWSASDRFDLYASQIVIREAQDGDPNAAASRLSVLEEINVLELTPQAQELAHHFVQEIPFPAKAAVDALHIAVAVVNGMDYLLTWNCAHIANAAMRHKIEAVCRSMGYEVPVICTPEELMEE